MAIFVLVAPSQSLAYSFFSSGNLNTSGTCRNIFSVETNAKKEQNKVRSEVNSARQKRSKDMEAEWQKRNESFQAERTKSDAMYNGFITSIKAKAKTPEEISAVNTFESQMLVTIKESREKVDAIWQEYKNATLLSLSNQDALSEKYFKEVEIESLNRLSKFRNLCSMNNDSEAKKESENIKKMKERGMARSAFLRKSKLEINQAAALRDKKIIEVRNELTQKITEIYNALPESLRK